MEKNGVIRKIDEPTEWVNLILVVEKSTEGLRISDMISGVKTINRKTSESSANRVGVSWGGPMSSLQEGS